MGFAFGQYQPSSTNLTKSFNTIQYHTPYGRGWQVSLESGQKLISPLDGGPEHSQKDNLRYYFYGKCN